MIKNEKDTFRKNNPDLKNASSQEFEVAFENDHGKRSKALIKEANDSTKDINVMKNGNMQATDLARQTTELATKNWESANRNSYFADNKANTTLSDEEIEVNFSKAFASKRKVFAESDNEAASELTSTGKVDSQNINKTDFTSAFSKNLYNNEKENFKINNPKLAKCK